MQCSLNGTRSVSIDSYPILPKLFGCQNLVSGSVPQYMMSTVYDLPTVSIRELRILTQNRNRLGCFLRGAMSLRVHWERALHFLCRMLVTEERSTTINCQCSIPVPCGCYRNDELVSGQR